MIEPSPLPLLMSAAMLACFSMAIFSCTACWRKIRGKKDKKKENETEDVEKGETADKSDETEKQESKKENGVSNTAYETAPEAEQNKTSETPNSDGCLTENAATNGEVKMNGDGNQCGTVKATQECADSPENDDNTEENKGPQDLNGQRDDKGDCTNVTDIHPNPALRSTSVHSADVLEFGSIVQNASIQETIKEEEYLAPPPAADDVEDESLSVIDDVTFEGGWRRKVKLKDVVDLGLIDKAEAAKIARSISEQKTSENSKTPTVPDSLKPFLFGKSPVAGILLSEVGEKRSIFSSAKDGNLRRGMAISLLEAQAATGSIIDPSTGRNMSVSDAFQLGLFDKVYETVISRAERAVTGYKSRISNDVLSLGQAIGRGLVIEAHGIRLLEAQHATGGVIDHKTNLRLPLDVAVKQGLLTEPLADTVREACSDKPNDDKPDSLKTFFDPNTEENVTYSELLKRCVVDTDTGMRLFPLEKIRSRKLNYGSHSGRSSLASSRASSKESITAAVAASP